MDIEISMSLRLYTCSRIVAYGHISFGRREVISPSAAERLVKVLSSKWRQKQSQYDYIGQMETNKLHWPLSARIYMYICLLVTYLCTCTLVTPPCSKTLSGIVIYLTWSRSYICLHLLSQLFSYEAVPVAQSHSQLPYYLITCVCTWSPMWSQYYHITHTAISHTLILHQIISQSNITPYHIIPYHTN